MVDKNENIEKSFKPEKEGTENEEGIEKMLLETDEEDAWFHIKISEKKYNYPINIKMTIHKYPEHGHVYGIIFGVNKENKVHNWSYYKENFVYCFNGLIHSRGYIKEINKPYHEIAKECKEVILSINNQGEAYYIIDGVSKEKAYDMPFESFHIIIGTSLGGKIEIS